MKKILVFIIFTPIVGYSQNNLQKESKFNFTKSNNYGKFKEDSKNKYNKQIHIEKKVMISKNKSNSSNKSIHNIFDKGLVNLISDALKPQKEVKKFKLKRKNEE
tara:strand:+ start:1630 stop:1941 length:312 start_codon:yes stop_codon:yes gene_type:complete